MHRFILLLIGLMLLFLPAPQILAQAVGNVDISQACDKDCQQKKADALFKALDDAVAAQRPKPSDTLACSVYDGRKYADVAMDTCRKLKYVRSLPLGTATNFPCPGDTAPLLGLSAEQIRSLWGEPDYEENQHGEKSTSARELWTYFIGSPQPESVGGGFPELTLELDASGNVAGVDCAYSR